MEQQKNLMNRFGGPRQAAPLAPMQQRKPGMVEQFAQGKANEFANEQMNAGLGLMKDQAVDALGNIGGSLGFGAEAGSGMEAAMFEAAPFEAIGAEGITATGLGADVTALGTGLAEGVGASTAGTAAATGGAATGLAAAMPWVGAGLLAGKAFGLFSEGGPVDYKMCGGKAKYRAGGGPLGLMALDKYHQALQNDPSKLSPAAALFRAEGGDTGGFWNYFKKSFTEKPSWEDNVAVQVPVLDGNGNPTNMTSTVYRPNPNAAPVAKRQPAPVEDRSVNLDKQIARDIYGEYDDDEDMGDASYLAGDPAPYSVQTYSRKEPAPRRRPTPLMPTYEESMGIPEGGDEWTDIDVTHEWKGNNKMMPSYTPNHVYYQTPGQDANKYKTMDEYTRRMKAEKAQREAGAFNMGGRVGPLKSVKYKSAGGDVSEQSYYNPYGK